MLRLIRPSGAIIPSFNIGTPLKFLLLNRFHIVPRRFPPSSQGGSQRHAWKILPDTRVAFSFPMSTTILVQARDPAKLTSEMESAVRDGRHSEAWILFQRHVAMEGLPRKSAVNEIIVAFAETLDEELLQRAYEVFDCAVSAGKLNLLDDYSSIYLSLALSKVGLSVCASTVLRVLIKDVKGYPNVNAWSGVVAFACGSVEGSCLNAELVLEIGSLFRDGRVDPRKKENASLIAMKPDATAFNLALCGCLFFDVSRKAEELIELLGHLRVKKDAKLLVTIARVYERNGRREDLKKLRRFIEEAPDSSVVHLCQFYDCLLSCHLKHGDLNSASKMVLEMIRKAKEVNNSIVIARFTVDGFDSRFSCNYSNSIENTKLGKLLDDVDCCILSFEEFQRDRSFDCVKSETQLILARLLANLGNLVELVTTEQGIIRPTEKVLVKLVKAFLKSGDIKGLVDFFVQFDRENSPLCNDDSALIHVINSCIALGWLDHAHDLLDEMSLAGVQTGSAVYNSLLEAYCQTNRTKEVTALLRDARKAGIQLDASCYEKLIRSKVIQKDTQSALDLFREMKSDKVRRSTSKESGGLENSVIWNSVERGGIMSKLLQEIRGAEVTNHEVHDWNNVIHFFCKKRLMNDAEKALKKMRSLGHSPNALTFHSLVTGYAAIGGKYIEVTELWGEMKAFSSESPSPLKFDQELLDSVLYTFVRGGFFSRANEVVAKMEKDNMFIDKFKYRTLFLKYHKTLYKGRPPKFQTEAQLNKRDATLAFKQWVGLQ